MRRALVYSCLGNNRLFYHAVSRKQRFPCSLLIAPNWPGAAAGSIDQLDERLRVSVEALLHPSPPPKPELDDLLSGITHHLDDEASERKAIHYHLLAIENEMKRPASRGFDRGENEAAVERSGGH